MRLIVEFISLDKIRKFVVLSVVTPAIASVFNFLVLVGKDLVYSSVFAARSGVAMALFQALEL